MAKSKVSNGLNHIEKYCDMNQCKNQTFKSHRLKYLTISIFILISALIINYLLKNNFSNFQLNYQSNKVQQINKIVKKDYKKDDLIYSPEKMVKFTDQLLQSTLDEFKTIENFPIYLKEISKFNNIHFAPRILSLVKLDPFKFVKFNLKRPCLLWSDSFSCTKM